MTSVLEGEGGSWKDGGGSHVPLRMRCHSRQDSLTLTVLAVDCELGLRSSLANGYASILKPACRWRVSWILHLGSSSASFQSNGQVWIQARTASRLPGVLYSHCLRWMIPFLIQQQVLKVHQTTELSIHHKELRLAFRRLRAVIECRECTLYHNL